MWEALDKAIQVEGWKLILLLRVSPLVPYNVMNVLLGSSGIHFSTFAFFSTIGAVSLPLPSVVLLGRPFGDGLALTCCGPRGVRNYPGVHDHGVLRDPRGQRG
jgi:membrane protein DedA with SNARE-associated domain